MKSVRPTALASLLSCVSILLGSVASFAQLHPPEIRLVYPLAGRPGAMTHVTISGISLRDASGVLFDTPDIVAKILPAKAALPGPTLESDGNPDLSAEFTVSKEAAPGIHLFRIVGPAGLSSLGKWIVGRDIPEVEERKPDDDIEHAQPIMLPSAIDGHIRDAGDKSVFAFDLEAGKTLVAEVNAAVVGSPLDSLLTLRDADGQEVASNDDYNGPDSLLTYTAPKSGRAYLTLSSSVGAGGPDDAYRLNVGYLPLVTAVFPVSVQRGKTATITPIGINLPKTLTTTWPPAGSTPTRAALWFTTPEGATNSMPVFDTSLPTVTEQRPGVDRMRAIALPAPGIADGRFWTPDGGPGGDVCYYRFHAEASHRYVIDAQCQAIGSRADPMLTLYDAGGGVLAENDDTNGRDSHLDRVFDKAGDYFLRIKEVTGHSEPDFVYRLVVHEPAPGFTLSTETRARVVGQGDSVPFEVNVARDRWDGPITLTVVDLPSGVTSSTCVVPAGVGSGLLVLSADPTAPLGAFPLHIVGTAQVNGQTVRETLTQASDWIWNGGARTTRRVPPESLQFAVGKAFEIAPKVDVKELALTRGQSVKLKVHVEKRVAYAKGIVLRMLGLPDGVQAADVAVPADKMDAEIEIKAAPTARLGLCSVAVDALAENALYGRGEGNVAFVLLDRVTPALALTVAEAPKK